MRRNRPFAGFSSSLSSSSTRIGTLRLCLSAHFPDRPRGLFLPRIHSSAGWSASSTAWSQTSASPRNSHPVASQNIRRPGRHSWLSLFPQTIHLSGSTDAPASLASCAHAVSGGAPSGVCRSCTHQSIAFLARVGAVLKPPWSSQILPRSDCQEMLRSLCSTRNCKFFRNYRTFCHASAKPEGESCVGCVRSDRRDECRAKKQVAEAGSAVGRRCETVGAQGGHRNTARSRRDADNSTVRSWEDNGKAAAQEGKPPGKRLLPTDLLSQREPQASK